jgi:sialate O-acetylesterase
MNQIRKLTWKWIAVLGLVYGLNAEANITLPAIFGDHMVLQQQSPITVWGWAQPGEKITIRGTWQPAEEAGTTAPPDGQWSICIQTPDAGGPYSLSIIGDNTIVLNDILIGEVWLCAGQSNMKLSLDGFEANEEMKKAIETADYPTIREFFVPRIAAAQPQSDCQGHWQVCTPQTAGSFSAVAFFFGRELNQKLHIPIGLINASWGGTSVEAWTSKKTLATFDAFRKRVEELGPYENSAEDIEKYEKALLEWEQKLAGIDPGTKETWQNPALDDTDWKTMELPSSWTGTQLANVDGILWFRRAVQLPKSLIQNDLELHLGLIDDMDTVWINGVAVGRTLAWMKPRVYRIPVGILQAGINMIAIRVIDLRRGEGGFTGKAEELRIGPVGADPKTCISLAGEWKYKFSHPTPIPDVPLSEADKRINQYTPTVIYNGMIHPLINFRIAGSIWYQGESNCYNPILYRSLFPAMIADWRAQWNQGEFPFYYVQIAPFEYGKETCSQAIREAQLMTLDKVPNVGMAVLMDIGEAHDIHPKNKWDVGERLARWALAKTYGQKEIVYSGPLYKEMRIEQNKIRILFNYTDGGLVARGGPLTDFTIAGEDRNFMPAKAVIEGDSIVVSGENIQNPVAVRYAWSNWACPNLFNAAGLPASSFRTDDWPLQ